MRGRTEVRILDDSEKAKIAVQALELGISDRKKYPESRVLPALFAA
jgi:hypothetical protein